MVTNNHEDNIAVERIIGRLEHAVMTLETRIPALMNTIEQNRQERISECARHWAITNALVRDLEAERGAHDIVAKDAQTARAELLSTATETAAKAALDATTLAETKARNDSIMAGAIAAAAETARGAIASAAKDAREAVMIEAGSRRTQRHWLIERLLQAWPIAMAVVGYLIAKGGG